MASAPTSIDSLRIAAQRAFGAAWEMRLRREGIPFSQTFSGQTNNPKTTYAVGSVTTVVTATSPIGRSRLIHQPVVGADVGGLLVAAQYWDELGATNWNVAGFSGTTVTEHAGAIPSGGGSVAIPFPSHGHLLMENQTFGLLVINPAGNSQGITSCVSASVAGIELTNDHNYDADYTIKFIGDSITRVGIAGTNGTTGMLGKDGFPWRIVNGLRTRGRKVRHINYGYSGFTTAQALVWMYGGKYDVPADLTVIGLGMNDALTTGVSPSAYQTNLTALVQHEWQLGTGSVVIWAPTATDDTNRTTNIGQIRTNCLAIPAAIGTANGFGGYDNANGQDVVAVDGSLSYTTSAGDISTYFAETGTPHIHPNIAGHGNLANVIGGGQVANGGTGGIAATRFFRQRLALSGWQP